MMRTKTRLICGVVLAVLVLTLASTAHADPLPICGDCNEDTVVTVADALLALQAAAGLTTLSATAAPICDVDLNGGASAADGLLIAQFSAGTLADLSCTSGGSPLSRLAWQGGTSGHYCVEGFAQGNPYTIRIFDLDNASNIGQVLVAGLPRGSTADALTAQMVAQIATTGFIATALPDGNGAANCFLVQDPGYGGAFIQIQAPICIPETATAAGCNFG